jgi:hypothetical protein
MSKTETPGAAVKRLQTQLADLQKLRANIPAVVLQPVIDQAEQNIRNAAAALSLPTPTFAKPPNILPIGTVIDVPVTPPVSPPVPVPPTGPVDMIGHSLAVGDTVRDESVNLYATITSLHATTAIIKYVSDGLSKSVNYTSLRWIHS